MYLGTLLNIFMKKHILLIGILFTNFCFAQIKFGSVQFGKLTNKEISGSAKDIKDVSDWLSKLNLESDKIEYTLNFNTSEAYFFANSSIVDNDGIDFWLAAINGRGKLKYYQNHNTKEYRDYRDSKRTGKVIVNEEPKQDWTLSNETKVLDGHKCYKATTTAKYNDGFRKQEFIFTAWYTPEIPFSYGPIGYGGLPGLILELQTDKATFFAKKINLSLDKEPEINKLISPKSISEETYLMMITGTYSKGQIQVIKEEEGKQKK